MTALFAPGFLRPGVLRFLLISLLALQLRGAEPEAFDLELLATQFGRFHLEDPERQSWSLVEDGAKISYRGMSWSAQRLRFHTKQITGLRAPLLDHFEATSGTETDDLSVEVDTRSYAAKGFPLRCLVQAQRLDMELVKEHPQALDFTCRLQGITRCAGRMRQNGAWLDFSLGAQELVIVFRCLKLGDGRISEAQLQRMQLRGTIQAGFDHQEAQRHLRIEAGEMELQFSHDPLTDIGQLDSCQVRGSAAVLGAVSSPAQVHYYADAQRRSYTARSMQLVLGTGARLKNFSCSSDLILSNSAWSGTIKACAAPSAD